MGQQQSKRRAARESQHLGELMQACERGDVGAARRILVPGVDVNAWEKGFGDRTPLIAASRFDHIDMATFLMDEAGANVNASNKDGWTALHLAGERKMVDLLLLKGAKIDAVTGSGWTPLHVSCFSLRDDLVRVLLHVGASVDMVDIHSERPIAQAVWRIASYPTKLGAGRRILRDLVGCGAAWDQKCESALTVDRLDSKLKRKWWQCVGPAIRFAVILWVEELQLGLELTDIPEEEIEKGLVATKTFVKELKASKHIVYRRTICVVGPSTAGKTSFIKSLIKEDACLEHIDDRTIGIDHFKLEFDEPNPSPAGVRRTHEVKFSDFAGQDVYQVMHSLFFTKRTLFLIAVDLDAYSIALLKSEMLTQDDAKKQHMMNEYVDRTVLSWIRIIFARQPDAEFTFIYTKQDTISSGPCVDKEEVLTHARMMLERVMVVVHGLRQQPKRGEDQHHENNEHAAKPITHLWDARLHKVHDNGVKVIFTSSTSASFVQRVRAEIESLITESGRSYQTPEKYMQVLQILIKKEKAARKKPIHERIQATFVDVGELTQALISEVSDLDEDTARIILRTLRGCVDILWYEDMQDKKLQTTVMLDPQLLIEFLRQVINHKYAKGMIEHSRLSGLPYWKALNDDPEAMLLMKRLLQQFQLVHPATGEMAFDSDLIVPAYWKTNQPALWKFGGEQLRLCTRRAGDEVLARRVHWEFRFTHYLPETLFDHLVVATYSPTHPLDVGPDWMEYRDGELAACRILVSRDWKTHQRSLHLEAVLASTPNIKAHAARLWVMFTDVCEALSCVLKEHPGLSVTRFARTDDNREPSLQSFTTKILGRKRVERETIERWKIMDVKWMPPGETATKCLDLLAGCGPVYASSIAE